MKLQYYMKEILGCDDSLVNYNGNEDFYIRASYHKTVREHLEETGFIFEVINQKIHICNR